MKREYRLLLVTLLSSGLLAAACASGETVGGGNTGKGGNSGNGGRGGSSSTTGAGGASSTGFGGSSGSGQGGSFGSGQGGNSGAGQGGTFGSGQGGNSGAGQGGIVGTTGAGGSTATGCVPMAPTAALVTDFATTAPGTGDTKFTFSGGVMGGVTTYMGPSAPTVAASGGAMTITMNAAGGAMEQYVGAVLYFNSCVNASAYRGVSFRIGGTMTGCTMQYSTNDSAHSLMSSDPKGTCIGTCYSPQKPLTIAGTPTAMTVLWADATSAGMPALPIDPLKLTSIQWQFTIPLGAGTCAASITIDDVAFVP